MESTDERNQILTHWLKDDCHLKDGEMAVMQGDASTRRYYRYVLPEKSYVVMDAPPAEHNLSVFISIANALIKQGVHAPYVYASNIDQGFLLLEDLGQKRFLDVLNESNASELYQSALQTLTTMQTITKINHYDLPLFGEDWLWDEWAWHKEWFLQKYLNLDYEMVEMELDDAYASLAANITSQPKTFMHRDYHSANIMYLADQSVGVVDFQDAFVGPITYDAASLLRDCYVSWPEENVTQWLRFYFNLMQQNHLIADISFEEFKSWFDCMGVQRHLKALMTFARKAVRDDDPNYLQHMPRTLNYIVAATKNYPTLAALQDFYQNTVQEMLLEGA